MLFALAHALARRFLSTEDIIPHFLKMSIHFSKIIDHFLCETEWFADFCCTLPFPEWQVDNSCPLGWKKASLTTCFFLVLGYSKDNLRLFDPHLSIQSRLFEASLEPFCHTRSKSAPSHVTKNMPQLPRLPPIDWGLPWRVELQTPPRPHWSCVQQV